MPNTLLKNTPTVTLSNGITMPAAVFGVYQMKDPSECQKAVEDAIATGYRAIDTAASYGNEAAVGAALRHCGVPREELFITTKLWVEDANEDGARRAVTRSLELLGVNYIDLFLIHQPVGDVYGAWRTIEDFYDKGILRAIGVSNFSADRLVDFCHHQRIRPMVNQVEINPFCQQKAAREVMQKYGVQPEAWAPFAEGRNGLFSNPVIAEIAKKHGRTVGQIVLRYIFELGAVVAAKTVRPERMRENLDIFTFSLDAEDHAKLAALDTATSQFFSHQDPAIIEWFCSRHIAH